MIVQCNVCYDWVIKTAQNITGTICVLDLDPNARLNTG